MRGFTLLEMMLTVGLIAVTATFVGLNINQSDTQLANLEAKRFIALLNLAQDESILTGRPIMLTVDASARRYHFSPIEATAVFLQSETDEDDQEETDSQASRLTYDPKADRFYQPREFPEKLVVQFTRLAKPVKKNAGSSMVPKRVHEILNQDLFDKDEESLDQEPDEDAVVIEPNGLVSPFTLSLSIAGQTVNVGLDRFGRAALVENL